MLFQLEPLCEEDLGFCWSLVNSQEKHKRDGEKEKNEEYERTVEENVRP